MRIKSGPGKPRLVEILPQPSLMALTSLSPQFSGPTTHQERHENNKANEDNSLAHCSIVPETCDNDDQNTTHNKQAQIPINDMAVEKESRVNVPETSENGDQNIMRQKQTLEKESCKKVPQKQNHAPKIHSEIDWSEKEVCIKCDGGGKLLVCSEKNCPLAVHEECMRCSAHFDSNGNFFCPYCSYKNVINATRKARKKAMLAKKALSVFLNKPKLDGGPLNEKVEMVKSGGQNLPKNKEVNKGSGKTQENHHGESSGQELGMSNMPLLAETEKNNVVGKCVDNGRSVDGREESENRIVTEQASEGVREENPETINDLQNKIVAVIGKKRKLIVEPENTRKGSWDSVETEKEEENSKIDDDLQNKGVERHDQETSVIGIKQKLVIEPEKSTEASLDDEDEEEEEEDLKIDNNFQNKIVEGHDREASVIGKKQKAGVERENNTEGSLDDSETEKEDNPKIVDDLQNKMDSRDKEAPVIEENPKLVVGHEKTIEVHLENTDIEKEEIQDRGEESSMEEHDVVVSDSSDGVSEGVLRSSRRISKKIKNVTPTDGEKVRRTKRELSFEGDGNKAQKEKSNSTSKSKQSTANTGFPNAKRKRVPWTAEEEEMLKEGVGRFSSKVNKNLSWRKILEFGRHVFHGSRTPDNLRDKWRNLHSTR